MLLVQATTADLRPLILETRTKHGETAHDDDKGILEHENHIHTKINRYDAVLTELSGSIH